MSFVLMFSGQGSQYFHMASKLYAHSSAFRRAMDDADAYVARRHGFRVLDRIYDRSESKGSPFDASAVSNAAIVMIETSVARVLEDAGARLEIVLGTSLGEVAACVVAGVLRLEDGLDVSIDLAHFVEARAERGKMFAVLARPSAVSRLDVGPWQLAATFSGHFVASVVGGAAPPFARALDAAGIRTHEVGVSFPFHSSAIDGVREPFIRRLREVEMRLPTKRLVSCATTETVPSVSPEHLWAAVRRPIAFDETLARLHAEGIRTFIDGGPSGSLAGHTRAQLPSATVAAVLTPFGHDDRSLATALDAIAAARLHGTSDRATIGSC